MKNKKSLSILILVLLMLTTFTACSKPSEEKISSQMKAYLYEKYGEEFEVENIGYRTANKDKFYQARIYPKSIIGTPKEDDDYYYGSASIDVNILGILSKETGDSYSFINRNDDVEKYLMPKAIELFGDRIRMKVDVKHEVTAELDYEAPKEDIWWAGYKSSSLAEMRKDVKENPKTTRIVLNIAIYVFDKIDSEEEKEERRKQLFEFLQFIKSENLDKYLTIDCNFMDDIVLAPDFESNRYILEDSEDKSERKEVIDKLREEVKGLNDKEYIENINKIKKSEFKLDNGNICVDFMISYLQILSIDYLKDIDSYGRYEERIKDNRLNNHYYKKPENIDYSDWDENILKKENN